jgi:hypothetical protein
MKELSQLAHKVLAAKFITLTITIILLLTAKEYPFKKRKITKNCSIYQVTDEKERELEGHDINRVM